MAWTRRTASIIALWSSFSSDYDVVSPGVNHILAELMNTTSMPTLRSRSTADRSTIALVFAWTRPPSVVSVLDAAMDERRCRPQRVGDDVYVAVDREASARRCPVPPESMMTELAAGASTTASRPLGSCSLAFNVPRHDHEPMIGARSA